jgi:hypothetical protein
MRGTLICENQNELALLKLFRTKAHIKVHTSQPPEKIDVNKD